MYLLGLVLCSLQWQLDNVAANGVLSTVIFVKNAMCSINCNRVNGNDTKTVLCHHLTTTHREVITCDSQHLFIYETEPSHRGAADPWSDRGSRGFGEASLKHKGSSISLPVQTLMVNVCYRVHVWRTLGCAEVDLLQGTRIDSSNTCAV